MRIVFKNLSSVKKESIKLHKAAKSVGLKSNISTCQNVIAEAYGWKHYNEMSLMHDRIQRGGLLNNIDSYGVIDADKQMGSHSDVFRRMKVATAMSGKEKLYIDAKMRASVISLAKMLKGNDIEEESLLSAFFNDKGLLKKYFSSENSVSISSLSGVLDAEYKRGTLVSGGYPDRRLSFYLGMPLQKALDNGGVFFLPNHLAKCFVEEARSMDDNAKLNVIDINKDDGCGGDYWLANTVNIDVLRYTSIFSSPMLMFAQHYLHDNKKKMNKELLSNHTLFVKFLAAYGISMGKKDNGMSLSIAVNNLTDQYEGIMAVGGEHSLGEMPDEFNQDLSDFIINHMLKPFWSETHQSQWGDAIAEKNWSFNLTDEILNLGLFMIQNMMSFRSSLTNNNGRPSPREGETLSSLVIAKEIVIVSFDGNDAYQLSVAKSMLAEYRSSVLTPSLGDSIEGERKDVVKNKYQWPIRGSVVVLDSYESYFMLGMSVVTAQARALGIFFIFHVHNSLKSPEEYCSLIANIGILIHLTIPSDIKGRLVDQTGVLKNVVVRDYFIRQMDSRQCLLEKEGVIIVSVISDFRHLKVGWTHSVVKMN
jgi:hypothetical protein